MLRLITLAASTTTGHGEQVNDDDHAIVPRLEYSQRETATDFNRIFFIGATAFVVLWSTVVIWAGKWFLAPIAAVMASVLGFWLGRNERLAITVEGQQLVVTNLLRIHRIDRDDILGFVIEPGLLGSKPTLDVKLKDFTSISCDVMAPHRGASTRADLHVCQAELTTWLDRQPHPE